MRGLERDASPAPAGSSASALLAIDGPVLGCSIGIVLRGLPARASANANATSNATANTTATATADTTAPATGLVDSEQGVASVHVTFE